MLGDFIIPVPVLSIRNERYCTCSKEDDDTDDANQKLCDDPQSWLYDTILSHPIITCILYCFPLHTVPSCIREDK